MIRLPVAVDPVNEIRSTLGESVSSSPTRWSADVTTLTTPGGDVRLLGDEAAEAGGVPGGVGGGLDDHGVARGQDRAHLVERDLDRVVPRHDGADDAHGLLDDAAPARHPHLLGVGEGPLPLELVDHLGRPAQSASSSGQSTWAAKVIMRGVPTSAMISSRNSSRSDSRADLELLEAALAQRAVGRPVGLVEGPPGGVDGPAHVLRRRVGDFAEHLLGGGVDVVEAFARRGFHELAVNEHADLTATDLAGHASTPFGSPRNSRPRRG